MPDLAYLRSLISRKRRPKSRTSVRHGLSIESLESRQLLTYMPYGATELDLGEFLLGDVAVTPVLLESNGQLDTSSEDWTEQQINEVLGNIDTGLDWWVETLATKTTLHQLEFKVDETFALDPFETKYEPISRRSNDYSLYVSEFLAAQGYSASGNLELDMRAFNNAQREKLQANWSFTIFVVPSVNDSDGQFQSGGSFGRAFGFAGGLFMIVPSTRPASTYTHETAHMFWGRDEYVGGGNYFQRRGYYNTQNLNAYDNPEPGFVQQPSIMASGSLLETAYINHLSPDSTLAMLGWQDSDSDGIFDVLDVPHLLTGTGFYDPQSATYRFQGEATVQTLPNLNSSGLQNDITLNRIREIEYRFDDGPWQIYSLPDAYETVVDMSVAIPGGASQIQIRARDSQTTVESNVFTGRLERADVTPTPGINGFVWIDDNRNGLRDLGEYGQQFWTVELVDSAGSVLDLRRFVEPDDFADGQLLSGFSPDLTLRAVGTDTDGRIGIFADSLTSTGTKNFRVFSKGSQSYISSWNSETRRMQATFSKATGTVSIDAVGSSNVAYGRLEAFDSSGQLIGRYTTSSLALGQTETMTITSPDVNIAYVIVGAHAGTSVKLDNLQFGPQVSTLTGPQGQYAFSALPAGSYNVRVTGASGFVARDPTGGVQSTSVSMNTATTDVDFEFIAGSSPWQNPLRSVDVNADGFVTALDVLLIVNDLNNNGARRLSGTEQSPPPYIDVSGDGFVSALDVLLVVNHINRNGSGEGESESGSGGASQFSDSGRQLPLAVPPEGVPPFSGSTSADPASAGLAFSGSAFSGSAFSGSGLPAAEGEPDELEKLVGKLESPLMENAKTSHYADNTTPSQVADIEKPARGASEELDLEVEFLDSSEVELLARNYLHEFLTENRGNFRLQRVSN